MQAVVRLLTVLLKTVMFALFCHGLRSLAYFSNLMKFADVESEELKTYALFLYHL